MSEREELHLEREEVLLLKEILAELKKANRPNLSFIKIAIGGKMSVGPATMNVGDKKVATVLGFDQNGAPFAIDFTANPVTFSDDNEAVLQDDPTQTFADPLTALSAGVANLTATCAGFTDTETITVLAVAPKLASIKVSID